MALCINTLFDKMHLNVHPLLCFGSVEWFERFSVGRFPDDVDPVLSLGSLFVLHGLFALDSLSILRRLFALAGLFCLGALFPGWTPGVRVEA